MRTRADIAAWVDVSTFHHVAVFRDDAGTWWKVVKLGVRIRDVYESRDDDTWLYRGRIRTESSEPRRLRAAIQRAGLEAA